MSDIRAIRNEADYNWALAEVEPYFENEPAAGSAEADRFDILSTLIEAYEAKHWSIEPADPVEAITYVMALSEHTQAELGRLLGSASRASEILNRKRPLTLNMAYRLHREWHIPAEALLRPYHLETGKAATRKRRKRGSPAKPASAASSASK